MHLRYHGSGSLDLFLNNAAIDDKGKSVSLRDSTRRDIV